MNPNMQLQAHPWHGISPGANAPEIVNAFIEIVPTDTMKYEVDKSSGHLKIDRPQLYSNMCPALYGFIPRTLCKERVAKYANEKTNRTDIVGDDDPIDIIVITERPVNQGSILVTARVIGGLRMIDDNEADDKIVAVISNDPVFENVKDISEMPKKVIDRLRHYFLTYKQIPDPEHKNEIVEISHVYGAKEAFEVIECSMKDYRDLAFQ